ncbi:sialate O-acetylesterase [Ruficoccus amylovorans]|uniref:sialate O-acetylesterase n=1 Tax=Ruficoccus amylovorans TaxID=1804625 RepID=UPI001C8C6562
MSAAPSAHADVTLAPLFRDGAVFQQNAPVVVWGQADPDEAVEVSFGQQSLKTQTDAQGDWSVSLAPMEASFEPQTLTVKGKNTLAVKDILVGEVWLCSGQSNMEWRVRLSNNASQEMASANFPAIRQFKPPRTAASDPQKDVVGEWVVCSPDTVGEFTAVGYFFARTLREQLGVPVGIINSTWGGTQIESWISAEAISQVSSIGQIEERWQERLKDYPAAMSEYNESYAQWKSERDQAIQSGKKYTKRAPREPEGPGSRWEPSSIFNGMVAPLVPYTVAGVLWYQGESNQGHESEYAELFTTMIGQWRETFQNEQMPFYFVQLANCIRKSDPTGEAWAYLREAQAAALDLPNTGMAVAIDIGTSNDIHPRNKQEVGRRLALLALRDQYGYDLSAQGPRLRGAKTEGARVVLSFDHAEGLNSGDEPLTGFFIAGENRQFYPAQAVIENDTVVVSSGMVPEPVAVRYAWANDPVPAPTLQNAARLPAEPFRTDNW